MAEFPARPFIGNWPISNISTQNAGGIPNIASVSAVAWTLANRAVFVPVRIPSAIVARQFIVPIGAASGNIDVGLYTPDGVRLISTGSVVSTAGAMFIDFANTKVGPGLFYFALSCNNTTITIHGHALITAPRAEMYGAAQMDTAFPLPATATLATPTFINLPTVAMIFRTGVI